MICILVQVLPLENLEFFLYFESKEYYIYYDLKTYIRLWFAPFIWMIKLVSYISSSQCHILWECSVKITQVWCISHLEFVSVFQYSSLWLCRIWGSQHPGQSHREPGSWEVAQYTHQGDIGRNWTEKKVGQQSWAGSQGGCVDVSELHRVQSHILYIKEEIQKLAHLKSLWLFFLIQWCNS
jgi:hypothetical protein